MPNLEANGSKSIKATPAVCAVLSASGFELPTRKSAADSALTARQTQVELVPEIKDEDRSKYGNDYAAGVKSASGAWRIKQMGYGTADNRADNAQHDCPRDRQMCVQQRFCDATRQETDDDIPDKMKHVFLVTFCDFEINP